MQDAIKRVRDAYQNKRGAAVGRSEERKEALYPMIPGLLEIDKKLAATAPKVLSAAISGKNVDEQIKDLQKENAALRKKRGELLLAAGYPADYTDIVYECSACGDTGFVGVNMCSCMRRAIAQAMLEDSGLGKLALAQSFDTFSLSYYKEGRERASMEHNLRTLQNFAKNFDEKTQDSFLLVGSTGLGKTHLSTATAVAIIEKGYEVVYKTIQSMLDDFEREQFGRGSYEDIRMYYEADLLIVDDLGAEMSTQFTVSCIYNVVNMRINNGKPTIISTNLTQSELRERYADRITGRLFGEYKPLLFGGVDIRRQKLAHRERT